MLLGLTWEGVSMYISILLFGPLAKFIFGDFKKEDFYFYLCWVVPVLSGLLIFTRAYRTPANYSSAFALPALGIPVLLRYSAHTSVLPESPLYQGGSPYLIAYR